MFPPLGASTVRIARCSFTILAADCSAARSILVFKQDEDKIHNLGMNKLAACGGPNGDCTSFIEFVQRNLVLNGYRMGVPFSTAAVANFTRGELAKAVRKRPYQVSLLIGGVDAPLVAPASKSAAADGAAAAEEKGAASVAAEEKHVPSLFFLDYMGTLQKVNFAAQGICGNFILSLFDRHWKAGMTMDEAKELVHACLEELKTRFMLSQPNFSIKVVNAAGSEVLDASWQVS